jgi:hypothetical protein
MRYENTTSLTLLHSAAERLSETTVNTTRSTTSALAALLTQLSRFAVGANILESIGRSVLFPV